MESVPWSRKTFQLASLFLCRVDDHLYKVHSDLDSSLSCCDQYKTYHHVLNPQRKYAYRDDQKQLTLVFVVEENVFSHTYVEWTCTRVVHHLSNFLFELFSHLIPEFCHQFFFEHFLENAEFLTSPSLLLEENTDTLIFNIRRRCSPAFTNGSSKY